MIVKFTTSCNFAGCDTEHIVKVCDDSTEEDLAEFLAEYISGDIQPDGSFEILDDDDEDIEIDEDLSDRED